MVLSIADIAFSALISYLPIAASSTFFGVGLASSFIMVPSWVNSKRTKEERLSLWREHFGITASIQISLMVASLVGGLSGYFLGTGSVAYLVGCALSLSTGLWTRFVIWPMNVQLFEGGGAEKKEDEEVKELLRKWDGMSRFRVYSGALATMAFWFATL